MWSLNFATVTASAPEWGAVSATMISAPSRPRASTSGFIREVGVAYTGGFSAPPWRRRSCQLAADACGSRSRIAVGIPAPSASAPRAHERVVLPVPPFWLRTAITRGRGPRAGIGCAVAASVITCSGACALVAPRVL